MQNKLNKLQSITRQAGISLLEVLLAVGVGAAIITVATHYFTLAQTQSSATNGLKEIQQIISASYKWLDGNPQETFGPNQSTPPQGESISIPSLIEAGLISPSHGFTDAIKNPWGGTITLGPAADPKHVIITYNGVPTSPCESLRRKTTLITDAQQPTADECKSGKFSGVF